MTRYDRRLRLLATAMAAQAGFVDALGFLHLGGYFVSFMSGNATRMAVESTQDRRAALIAATLLALFVVGVMAGTMIRRSANAKPIARVQGSITLMLAVAAVLHGFDADRASIALMVMAMGAANAAFERDGEVAIGVTYVTGALVKMGQQIVSAWSGGSRTAWIWQGLLWLGLAGGAVLGAPAFRHWALGSLWIAVVAGTALTQIAARIEHRTS